MATSTQLAIRSPKWGRMYRKFEPKPRRPVELPTLNRSARPASIDALKASLSAGVQVVSAPQLFPTPPDVARRMVKLANIQDGDAVLEPSAGTGNILAAIDGIVFMPGGVQVGPVTAIEINHSLAVTLGRKYPGVVVHCHDFLAWHWREFDVIVMNPPFERGSDIKHIQHARTMLRPGGRLVAICANGPRQQAKLIPLTDSWEPLPRDTFSGTGVSAALLRIRG